MRELWQYRELVWFFISRDIKTRYQQTILGLIWVVVPGLMSAGLFTLIFGIIAGISTGDLPTPAFMYSGLLPWMLFSRAYGKACNALFGNATLYTKVYFPRLISPIAGSIGQLVDFGMGMILMLLMMAYYYANGEIDGIPWYVVFLPLYLLMALVTAMAVGLWFAAASVRYRDIRLAGALVPQFWMWVSPVVIPSFKVAESTALPEWAKMLYFANPICTVVDGFRWCLLGVQSPQPVSMQVFSVGLIIVLLIGGLIYFKRVESTFVDVV